VTLPPALRAQTHALAHPKRALLLLLLPLLPPSSGSTPPSSWSPCCAASYLRRADGLGIKLAVSEYAFGGDDLVTAAVATAEALAVFAREGVDSAIAWTQVGRPARLARRRLRSQCRVVLESAGRCCEACVRTRGSSS